MTRKLKVPPRAGEDLQALFDDMAAMNALSEDKGLKAWDRQIDAVALTIFRTTSFLHVGAKDNVGLPN